MGYEDRDYVSVINPGEGHPTKLIATEDHKKRWPNEWAAFSNHLQQTPDGTPLDRWPRIRAGYIVMLNSVGVYTLEQLADVDDVNIAKLPPGWGNVKKEAQGFLSQFDQLDELKEQVEQLRKENLQLKTDLAGK